MPSQGVDVAADGLTIGSTIFPPSGETERFRIVFPAFNTVGDSNSGDTIVMKVPYKSATGTLSCYQTDAAHILAEQIYAAMQAETSQTRTKRPGSCSLAATPDLPQQRVVRWSDTVLVQRSDWVSSQSAEVVTWEWRLVDAVVTVGPTV